MRKLITIILLILSNYVFAVTTLTNTTQLTNFNSTAEKNKTSLKEDAKK